MLRIFGSFIGPSGHKRMRRSRIESRGAAHKSLKPSKELKAGRVLCYAVPVLAVFMFDDTEMYFYCLGARQS